MQRLRARFRRKRMERELDDEFQFHLERQIEQNIARGMDPREARYAALRAMGGFDRHKEAIRDTRGLSFVEHLLQDARYAARVLRRSLGFAAVGG